jgi:predicted ABC-type ATPase
MANKRPRMVVIAGPSGSGKSSFFSVTDYEAAGFNVDDRCAELNQGSYRNISPEIRAQAQLECQELIEACTRDLRSFAVETTLRTDISIQQAKRAKAAGYRLEMVFVATDNVDENVLRVARRGIHGGHSAPEPRLREIYRRSLENLPGAIRVFDEVALYDSSAFEQARASSHGPEREDRVARWAAAAMVPLGCPPGALRRVAT